MDRQSVLIDVDRLVVARLLADDENGVSYAAPESVPGVTGIALTLNHSIGTFYADGGVYETFPQQGDIEASVSLAGLSAEKRAEYTGANYSATTGLVVDGKADNPPYVAIGFRSQKANGRYRYVWLYKGKFSKSDSANRTKSGSVTPQPEKYTFKAAMRDYDGNWRQMLDSDDANLPAGLTDSELSSIVTGWFSSPDYVPAAPGTPITDLAAATGISPGQIVLTFPAPTGLTNARAQVRDASLGIWVDAMLADAITGASTSAVITGLTAGNTYECRLVVTGGARNGISNTDSAAAGPLPDPLPSQGLNPFS